MRFRGFTLAETLVTLGIIGVIAAITISMMNKFQPDDKKIMYLKAYDSLAESVKSLSNSSSFYPHTVSFSIEAKNYVADVSKYPLYNIWGTHDKNHQSVTGESKLCELIAESMNGQNVNCNATVSASDSSINWSTPSFTTQNGMAWIIGADASTANPQLTASGDWESKFLNNVYVKLKPDGNSCLYDTNCADPNVFKFAITADGNIHIADEKGAQYAGARTFLGIFDSLKTGKKDNVVDSFVIPVTCTNCGSAESGGESGGESGDEIIGGGIIDIKLKFDTDYSEDVRGKEIMDMEMDSRLKGHVKFIDITSKDFPGGYRAYYGGSDSKRDCCKFHMILKPGDELKAICLKFESKKTRCYDNLGSIGWLGSVYLDDGKRYGVHFTGMDD